ncbi:MAG: flavin prenyltransferase UbiX [Fluviicoccus sp.]|uniref:flavin prenyltransferase UbiX n=1 Tax=Fluviicoccus sp. TaxID=2003552 RepID=UPI00271D54F0|nr:flavin prenyltransferase UbiX [Fluviicoccus sp.]MDO8330567.1 flavin prenyltransferase UbiX [Fluviicoccus sp.]
MPHRLTLALTGASGMPYALALLKALVARQQQVYLLVSDAAREVLRLEHDIILPADRTAAEALLRDLSDDTEGRIRLLDPQEWTAAPASGSGAPRRMIICPCSMGTLAAVATGLSNNLIERAADVVIKEGHRLVIVPREMPFSTIHLQHMLTLAKLGVTVMPPCPGFYHRPTDIDGLVGFVVDRVLKQVGLEGDMTGWGT